MSAQMVYILIIKDVIYINKQMSTQMLYILLTTCQYNVIYIDNHMSTQMVYILIIRCLPR